MVRSPRTPHRARARLAVALAVAAGVLAVPALPAAGQEAPAESSTTTSTTTTTTAPPTTAPPVTVDLGNGDIGVLPPGAVNPNPPPPGGVVFPPPDGEDLEVPQELPVVILPDPTPGLNAALAAIDVSRARAALTEAEDGRRAAEAAVREAFTRRAEAVSTRRAAGEEVREAEGLVEELAINALIHGNIAQLEPVLAAPDLDYLRDVELSTVVSDKLFRDLEEAEAGYREAVEAELEVSSDLVVTLELARNVRSEYLRLRAELDEAIRHADEARRQAGPTILGPSVLESADLVAWYRKYYRGQPAVAPIEQIIGAYLEIGEEEGVAGDIAFAQAILETGGFRSGHSRKFNFAGIGAYDHCSPECSFSFPDLESGVRAHIHLLRAYADPGLTSAQLARSPNPLVAPENVGVGGCCERWTELTGVWATDPNYDRKVLGIYRLMVETARERDRARA